MRKLMLLGTASSVGKSTIATAFCRYFKNKGLSVAPFKALNISLNSYVTEEGLEMGRAQVVQAEACDIDPKVSMNPVLLKPCGNNKTQVIVNGKVQHTMDAYKYKELNNKLKEIVKETFINLSKDYDVMILEGSGSCAEINLRDSDIANMYMAEAADADVILVADIDRGGVFASVLGTIMLLTEQERKRVKGVIINKFRGNVEYFKPAMMQLEEIINIPVLGVMPYCELDIEDEDSVTKRIKNKKTQGLDIVIIRLPHMSNFTDFTPLEIINNVTVRYICKVEEIGNPDLLIIPGTKNTINDLRWLKETNLFTRIRDIAAMGTVILGICGGYQMLGKSISDKFAVEGYEAFEEGLALLDCYTTLHKDKVTVQTTATVKYNGNVICSCNDIIVKGYEIHNGITSIGEEAKTFIIENENIVGIANENGNVFGTYLHGIFENGEFVTKFINDIGNKNGTQCEVEVDDYKKYKLSQYDKLAQLLEQNIDLYRIIEEESFS